MTESLLTIAGTDPSGGAGVQVDLQVFRDFDFHGLSVVTAVVCQNTRAVRNFESVERVHLEDQIDAIFEDIRPAAVKIGMIPTEGAAEVVGGKIPGFQGADDRSVVYDPVLASGSGESRLVRRGTREQLLKSLIPKVDWLTPNLTEAQDLLTTALQLDLFRDNAKAETPDVEHAPDAVEQEHRDNSEASSDRTEQTTEIAQLAHAQPDDLDRGEVESIAEHLLRLGPDGIVITGGHTPAAYTDEGDITDLLVTDDACSWRAPLAAVDTDVRGTGCQLSSAFCANLADGLSPVDALDRARAYLNRMIRDHAEFIGTGRPVVVRVE